MYAVFFFSPLISSLSCIFITTSSFQSAVTFVMETLIVLGAPVVVFFDGEQKSFSKRKS